MRFRSTSVLRSGRFSLRLRTPRARGPTLSACGPVEDADRVRSLNRPGIAIRGAGRDRNILWVDDMWNWFRKLGGRLTSRGLANHRAAGLEPQTPITTVSQTLDDAVAELHSKGYRGPHAICVDGILSLVFHGPDAPEYPRWLDPADNPFQMSVLGVPIATEKKTTIFTGTHVQ